MRFKLSQIEIHLYLGTFVSHAFTNRHRLLVANNLSWTTVLSYLLTVSLKFFYGCLLKEWLEHIEAYLLQLFLSSFAWTAFPFHVFV